MPEGEFESLCPKKRGKRIREADGSLGGRMVCNNRSCPTCWWPMVHRKALVLTHIGRVAPNALWVTLSDAPKDQAVRFKKMRALRRSLTAVYSCPVEIGWVTEISLKGAWHIHAIFHGAPVTEWILREKWQANVKALPLEYDVGLYMLKDAIGRDEYWPDEYLSGECQPDEYTLDIDWAARRIRHYELNANMDFRRTSGFFLESATFDEAYRVAREELPVRPHSLVLD